MRKYFWQIFINNANCINGCINGAEGKKWMLGMMDDVKYGNVYMKHPQKYKHLETKTDSSNFEKFIIDAYTCGAEINHKQMDAYIYDTEGYWADIVQLLRREINFDLHYQLLHEIIDFLFAKESLYVLADCLAFAYVHVITATDGTKQSNEDMFVLNWFSEEVDKGYSVGHVLLSDLCMHLLPIRWENHLKTCKAHILSLPTSLRSTKA